MQLMMLYRQRLRARLYDILSAKFHLIIDFGKLAFDLSNQILALKQATLFNLDNTSWICVYSLQF